MRFFLIQKWMVNLCERVKRQGTHFARSRWRRVGRSTKFWRRPFAYSDLYNWENKQSFEGPKWPKDKIKFM